nr:RNA-directed DNA polymerase, eukaryota, reverse transcriptase zinc-binding domain protein [Tanacetum cinerariifolium]
MTFRTNQPRSVLASLFAFWKQSMQKNQALLAGRGKGRRQPSQGTSRPTGIDLHSHVKKKVGNSEHTSFWDDVWLTESPLKHIYPRLFALECDKNVSVAGKFRYPSLIASFRRAPQGGIEAEQLHLLTDRVATVILSSINDK